MSVKQNLSAFILLGLAVFGLVPAAGAQDILSLTPVITVDPGVPVRVPVLFADRPGTPLGGGTPLSGMAITVAVAPAAAVSSVGFRRTGAFAGTTPRFEIESGFPQRRTWLVSFPGPLPVPPLSQIAELEVRLDPGLPVDSVVTLSLVAADTGVSNADGSVLETLANGELQLSGGTITVATPTVFSDGFDTGELTRWSATQP